MSLSLILPPPRHTANDDAPQFNILDKTTSRLTQPTSLSLSSSSLLSIHAEPLSSMQTAVAIRPAPIQAVSTAPSTRASTSSSSASTALALAAQRRGDPAAVIAGQNRRSNEIVQSSYDDMTEHIVTDEELRRPTAATVAETIAKTQAALSAQVDKAIAVARPNHVAVPSKEATFVRYTPSEQQIIRPFEQRIIRIQDAPIDPLNPPLFKYKKLPQRPPSPPVPILRSPPRKATKEELKQWDIPPCVSGWKNPHGYVIPLDKRMANDATALIDHSVSEKFAEVSEALYIAERTMRKEIEQRAHLMKVIRQNEANTANTSEQTPLPVKQESVTPSSSMPTLPSSLPKQPLTGTAAYDVTVQDGESDEEDAVTAKKSSQYTSRPSTSVVPPPSLSANPSRTNRDNDRDVGERMALGQVVRPVATGDQTLFDTRLFNQSAGMGSGFASDETYSLYDKPLFSGSSANVSYRPRPVALDDDNVVGNGAASLTGRAKPIEFEREADPFGLSALFEDASGGAPRSTSLDQVGQRGQMAASAASAGRSSSDRAEDELISRTSARSNSTRQRKMDFVAATEPTSIGTTESVRAGLRFTSSSPLPPAPAAPLPSKDIRGHIHSDRLHLFHDKQSAPIRSNHSDDQRRDDDSAIHRRSRREGDKDRPQRSDYRHHRSRSKSPRRRQTERDDGRDEFGRDRKDADEGRQRRRESDDSDDDRYRSRNKRSRHSR